MIFPLQNHEISGDFTKLVLEKNPEIAEFTNSEITICWDPLYITDYSTVVRNEEAKKCGAFVLFDTLYTMAIRVVEFSNGGYKIRKILAVESTTQRKLLNFENWVNGEVSKIGHHFNK